MPSGNIDAHLEHVQAMLLTGALFIVHLLMLLPCVLETGNKGHKQVPTLRLSRLCCSR